MKVVIKMTEEIIYEKELDIPENWETNTIFTRDGKGKIIEIKIPDDEE